MSEKCEACLTEPAWRLETNWFDLKAGDYFRTIIGGKLTPLCKKCAKSPYNQVEDLTIERPDPMRRFAFARTAIGFGNPLLRWGDDAIEAGGVDSHVVWWEAYQLLCQQVCVDGGHLTDAAWSQCVRLAEYRMTEAAKGLNTLVSWLHGSKTRRDLLIPSAWGNWKARAALAALTIFALLGCSSGSSNTETQSPGACGPSSCPMPQSPPSAPDPDGVCHAAILNMVRVGLFRLAEVDPPTGPNQEAIFCREMTSRGYDLQCIARAESALDAASCQKEAILST